MRLIPLTEEARRALGGLESIQFTAPFKVGRECRSPVPGPLDTPERRLQQGVPLNDLYLVDPPSPRGGFQVSRRHFVISQVGSDVMLTDLDSARGTCVGDRALGSESPHSQVGLHDGDVIVVGAPDSPYRYQFRLSAD